jgi:hypothetical protein
MRFRSGFALTLMTLALSAGMSAAHDGHDHGPQPAAPAKMAPRAEAASEAFELVVTVQGRELVFYLDRFDTNEPVNGATVEVETPDGPASAPDKDGVYRLTGPWMERTGRIDLIVTVTADGTVDVLPISLDIPQSPAANANTAGGWLATWSERLRLPGLAAGGIGFVLGCALMGLLHRRGRRPAATAVALILALSVSTAWAHDDHAPASAPSGLEIAVRQSDGAVFVPKPIQRIFGLRTVKLELGTFQRSIELPGRIIPDPNTSGYVQALVGGRLSPPPNGFPRLGARVQKGDVLGYVTPPLQAIDVSDMRQRQGELDQQIAIVERRVLRYQQLAPHGAVPQFQLDEARLELEGLRTRRASLDRVRQEPEALIAPVSGIVADGTPVAGQVAAANAVIFHIVEPTRLWIEALSFQAPSTTQNAAMLTADGKTPAIAFRGAGLADRNQSIQLHFAIEGDASGLRPGQFVTVLTQNAEPVKGLAVPRTAVVRASNGQELIYEHVFAERFAPRPVRTAPLDGERVLIDSGIEPGKRIVIQGAELLDHVR